MSNSSMSKASHDLAKVFAPVSSAEERRARRAAEASLRQGLGREEARFRVLWVTLSIQKPEESEKTPPRLLSVVAVDYGRGRNLELLVDPAGKIVETRNLAYRPPYSSGELEEARRISDADERVASMSRVAHSFVSAFGPDTGDDELGRLIGVRYATLSRDGGARLLGRVVVDLSAQRVVSVEEGNQESAEQGGE